MTGIEKRVDVHADAYLKEQINRSVHEKKKKHFKMKRHPRTSNKSDNSLHTYAVIDLHHKLKKYIKGAYRGTVVRKLVS